MSARIPPKYEKVVVEFLTQLFTGQHPDFNPTEERPIPVEKLYRAIWKRTNWGLPPEQETKKANGAWGNTRTAVRHMLENTDVLIMTHNNKSEGLTGYFRPTRPEHYDRAFETADKLANSYRRKAQLIMEMKARNCQGVSSKPVEKGNLFNNLFD